MLEFCNLWKIFKKPWIDKENKTLVLSNQDWS